MNDIFEDDRTPLMEKSKSSVTINSTNAFSKPIVKDISYKLSRRKKLLNRRQLIVTVEFILAMIGFVGMLVITELRIEFERIYYHNDDVIMIVKLLMCLTTILLLITIIMYYITEVKLIMTRINVENWRLVVTPSFVLKVCFELLICSIQPIPGHIQVPYRTIDGHAGTVCLDGILSIAMLVRLYIVVKFILMNTQWMMSTSMQSIGHLSKVETDFKFVLKCIMKDRPKTMVCSIMFAIFLTNSWAMRTCESYYDPGNELNTWVNSMWVVAITFVAVGYGDLSPNSYCGRFVSVDTGLMGIATTALFVTVVTGNLEQTRAQRYVHDFMAFVELEKNKKNYAADIIKWSMLKWSFNGRRRVSAGRKRCYQRNLNAALVKMRHVMRKLNVLKENAVDVVEIAEGVNKARDMAEQFESSAAQAVDRRNVLENRLEALDNRLDEILSCVYSK